MSDPNRSSLPEILGADVAPTDLLNIQHPLGGAFSERKITVAELGVALGLGAITAGQTAAALNDKYLNAVAAQVHMKKDPALLTVPALAGGASQALANARANALQEIAADHAASVGSPTVDRYHKAEDVTAASTLAAVDPATDIDTCITLISALFAWHQAHAILAGVHFNADTAPAGDSLTTDPPVSLVDCVADLNDLRTMMLAHFARGVS